MNKFFVGSEVLFEGNLGFIRAKSEYEREWEYAVEFDEPDGMENLFGCIDEEGKEIIPDGIGAWILEEELEAA